MLLEEALALWQLPIHLVQELPTRQCKGPALTRVTGWPVSARLGQGSRLGPSPQAHSLMALLLLPPDRSCLAFAL